MSKHEEQNQKWSVSKLPLSASTPQYHTARPAKSEYSTQTQLAQKCHHTHPCYLRMLPAHVACKPYSSSTQAVIVAHSHHTSVQCSHHHCPSLGFAMLALQVGRLYQWPRRAVWA